MSKTSTILIGTLAALVAGVIAFSGVQGIMNSNKSVDRELQKASRFINSRLPMMVDQHTRLDSTAVLPGKRLLYRYTLLNMEITPTRDEIVSLMRPRLINTYKTSTDMAELRGADVILVYSYFDTTGNELARFEIAPSDFQ